MISYTISFCVGLFLITYVLKLPHIITGKPNIVIIYYIKNYVKNVPLYYLFVLCYLLVSYLFIKLSNTNNNYIKTLIVALTTLILTSLFCYYFVSKKVTKNFFSQWFHTVGYSSVIYDNITCNNILFTYF